MPVPFSFDRHTGLTEASILTSGFFPQLNHFIPEDALILYSVLSIYQSRSSFFFSHLLPLIKKSTYFTSKTSFKSRLFLFLWHSFQIHFFDTTVTSLKWSHPDLRESCHFSLAALRTLPSLQSCGCLLVSKPSSLILLMFSGQTQDLL